MKKTAQQIDAECREAGLPVDRMIENKRGEVEAYFTRPLTEEENTLFEDIYHGRDYAEKRRREYPPLEEFADAYYWLQKGDASLMDAYISKCDAVKQKYPKGQSNG